MGRLRPLFGKRGEGEGGGKRTSRKKNQLEILALATGREMASE